MIRALLAAFLVFACLPADGAAFLGAQRAMMQANAVNIYRRLPFGSSNLVEAGDSIYNYGTNTAQESLPFQPGKSWMSGRAAWTWSIWQNGAPMALPPNNNAGVYGNTTAQLLARYQTDVISKFLGKKTGIVNLEAVTNDYTIGALTPQQTLDNTNVMLTYNRMHRLRTNLQLQAPRGTNSAQMPSDTLANWIANNANRSALAAPDVKIIDLETTAWGAGSTYVCPNSGVVCHDYGVNMTVDGLHPSFLGGYSGAQAYAPSIKAQWGSGYALSRSNTDPNNAVINGWMQGAAGTASGSVTGQIASGWTLTAPSGTTAAASQIPYPDGSNEQQINIGGTWSGTAGAAITLCEPINFGAMFSVGDVIEIGGVLDVSQGLLNVEPISLEASMNGLDIQADSIGTLPAASVTARTQPDGPYVVVLRSHSTTVPAAPGVGTFCLNIALPSTGSAANIGGVIKATKLFARKVPKPDILPRDPLTMDTTIFDMSNNTITMDAN